MFIWKNKQSFHLIENVCVVCFSVLHTVAHYWSMFRVCSVRLLARKHSELLFQISIMDTCVVAIEKKNCRVYERILQVDTCGIRILFPIAAILSAAGTHAHTGSFLFFIHFTPFLTELYNNCDILQSKNDSSWHFPVQKAISTNVHM